MTNLISKLVHIKFIRHFSEICLIVTLGNRGWNGHRGSGRSQCAGSCEADCMWEFLNVCLVYVSFTGFYFTSLV